MCEVKEDPDEMSVGKWRRRRRWRLRPGTAVVLLLPLICILPPAYGHIPVTAEEDVRIEPTPMVVMAGPSSRQVVVAQFLGIPLEGSGVGRRWSDLKSVVRPKREYSLEDFLMWMPSGDGPTEEWQHRPRDTSWMKGDVITTTVFLTTTVFTTIFQPPLATHPLTQPTLTPSTVTSTQIQYTKYLGNPDPSLEKPNRIPDKGGGKELGEGSTSNDVNQNCDNQTLDRPQSDYPQSENSGNRIPDTSRDKGTPHKVDKTNYITVTRTITTPLSTLHSSNPPILTTTSSFTQAEYDITDLVQPSVEYPGPSATITASSMTPSLSSTLPLKATLSAGPPTRETVINSVFPSSSSSKTYGSVVPTTTVNDEANSGEEQGGSEVLEPKGTTSPSETTEMSSGNAFLTPETLTTTDSGSEATPSAVGATGTDTGVGTPGDTTTTTAKETSVSDVTTEGGLNPLHDSNTFSKLHNPAITTEATADNTVHESTGTNLGNPATEGVTESSGNDPVSAADTEPSQDVGTTDTSTSVTLGGIGTSFSIPQEGETTDVTLDVYVTVGATETGSSAPVSEGPTYISPGDIDTATLSFPASTDLAHSPTTPFPPLFEINTTAEHEIELSNLTTPASDGDDSIFLGIYTEKGAPDSNGTDNGTFSVDFPQYIGNGSVLVNASDNGTQPPDQDIDGDLGSTDQGGSTSSLYPPAMKTESPSVTEPGITTGGVEAVDPAPVELGGVSDPADNVTVWEELFQSTTTDSPILITSSDDDNDTSTSVSCNCNDDRTSRGPNATGSSSFGGNGSSSPSATDVYGGGDTAAPEDNTTRQVPRPTEPVPASQVDGAGAEVFTTGDVVQGVTSQEEEELGTVLSPSKTVTPLSSSGVEASMSVVSLPVQPSQVTTPVTVSVSVPTVMDASSYPLESTLTTTTSPTGEPGILDASSYPPSQIYGTMTSPTGEPEILDTSSYPPSRIYSTMTSPTGETEILDTSSYPPSQIYSTMTSPTGETDILDISSYPTSKTYSTTALPTEPDILDTSPYHPGNTYSTTTSPTGEPEDLITSGTPPQDSSTSVYVPTTDEDEGGSASFTSTDETGTVEESSSVPSSLEPYAGETTGISPTLESSQQTSTETPETSPATYTSSLPTTEPDVIESTEEEETTQTSYAVLETQSSTETDVISTLTSSPSTSTTTTPVFITLFSVPQKPEIASTLSTTTLPVVHTSAGSSSVSSSSPSPTTEESRSSSPVWSLPGTPRPTEQTTGPQPSPPSPSNNATVPLDQRYWVRTVLEDAPKESNSQLYWSKMEAALTDIYAMAYERNFANRQRAGERKLELNEAPDGEHSIAMFGTESPSITTTVETFENYTTIIARVRRDVMDIMPTQPTRRLRAGHDKRIPSTRYKTAPALVRRKVLIPLHAMTMENKEKQSRKGYKKAMHVIKPSYNVRAHSRRKRWLKQHTKQESNRESKHSEELRSPYSKTHVLRKRSVAEDMKVRLHNVTYNNNTQLTELVYTVFNKEEPILASEAVQNMSTVDDMEMAVLLDQVVVVKAEEYLQGPKAPQKSSMVYAVIGGVVGGMMLLVFLIWLSVFLLKRHKRSLDELQPDSEAASPRSHMSANAFTGHVNLAFATNRDEKVESSPLPSTSHTLDQASPTTSHDSLIRKPRQGLGSSNARSRRHLRHRQDEEEEEEEETAQDDSPDDDDDGHTSGEEVPDGVRPKSGVPWRRLSRTTAEEPVYSSPNPAHIQYQPSHSTYSKYDTTHSELTSSDAARYGPTRQLMTNMLHSANSFTDKDQGSVFLPPPLLPPPQGFGKAHESPFIPGTSLPRFLPPPRLPKQVTPPRIPDSLSFGTPTRIQAYDYDPEAPPIPPRNYTREEAGLPPLAQGLTSPLRAQMKDAQVEAHMESDTSGSSGSGEVCVKPQQEDRRQSASSSHLSDSGGSEGSMPNIGRLRRRFHDLLDDAFSLLNGQRPGDKVTPLTTPSPPRKGRSRSAAILHKNQTKEVLEEEDVGGRPWSAAAVHTSSPAWRDSQVVGVVPLDEGRSPRSAWGDAGGRAGRIGSAPAGGRPGSGRPGSGRSARSITPVNMPPTSPDRPDGGRPSSGYAGSHARLEEPVDPDTGLRASDPAVPLIRAIKDELKRFKSTISTESSSA